ncbi:hypothetical protein EG68_02188 [Paragonimus skrjabini miyazakii]|uniref:BZIP domain-containing protein n=1 Tax=Paragonimus skrjabini miyazakii TaxID=59628 RepID=A0A8S9Z4A6_9TREM|nr:hypothetical protein EG68_02188 [Paragonimus skrjabini miyazakii]
MSGRRQRGIPCSLAETAVNNPRRPYSRVANAVKSTSSYVDRRHKNNTAVKQFRNRSKNKMQLTEEEINRYTHLTELFEQQRQRLESARETLETLVQRHVSGEDVTSHAYELINSEMLARATFRQELCEQLSDDEVTVEEDD